MRWMCIFAVLAGPALADMCPEPSDVTGEVSVLISEAQAAKNETAGRIASGKMWDVWLRAPDDIAQAVLDRGMEKRRSFDFVGAFSDFDSLVQYCPTYAEGYNQRAFVSFLTQNYARALTDLDQALVLSPNHVAAQSGRALTLMNLGRLSEARDQLLAAVENNPWLSERALLAPGAPLGPQGKDI